MYKRIFGNCEERSLELAFPFFQSFFAAVFFPKIFPSLGLVFFAPFLAIACIRLPFIPSLSLALFSGLAMDCMSSSFPFGIQIFINCFIVLLLHRFKYHFFEEKMISIAVYTAIFSFFYTISSLFLFSLFEHPVPFSWRGIISDLIIMPLIDGIYGIIWFSLPKIAFNYLLCRLIKRFSKENQND